MNDVAAELTNSPIIAAYRDAPRARPTWPSAAPSCSPAASRMIRAISIRMGSTSRAPQGPRKWDVDGNRYVDYFGGHGALLLGHRHPGGRRGGAARRWTTAPISAPATSSKSNGPSGSRPDPDARARALHLVRHRGDADGGAARARLHRQAKLIRFNDHFHGWHDHMAVGPHKSFRRHADDRRAAARGRQSCCCAPTTSPRPRGAWTRNPEIAAVIIEPTGAIVRPGADRRRVPARAAPADARAWRAADLRRGRQRLPGDAGRRAEGLRHPPRPVELAKIVAGGLPGGAVTGRKDILDLLDFQAAATPGRRRSRIPARSTPIRCRLRPVQQR